MSASSSLVSTQNRVESPFIIVKIGKYTFGHCQKSDQSKLANLNIVTYPRFIDSMSITKINGTVNTYVLNMTYPITQNDDPNLLEKVFSSISKSRTIYLSYGDWNMPTYAYKEEECLVTKLVTKVNLQASSITYTINCTSTALQLNAGVLSFPARKAKPSDVIMELLADSRFGLTNIFTGMKNTTQVAMKSLIARDDKKVQLEAKQCSTIDYISYLVRCMVSVDDKGGTMKSSCYFWSVYDDTTGDLGGTYFKVVKVTANSKTLETVNTFEVDVGYPNANAVTDFSVNNDDSWALLYDYSAKISIPKYSYSINNAGEIVAQESSALTNSSKYLTTLEDDRNWWSMMTQFPITASLTIKGLLRPAILMSYVKVNVYFYGRKHVTSGMYIITKQEDRIDGSGYRTTLSLTRVSGDESYV